MGWGWGECLRAAVPEALIENLRLTEKVQLRSIQILSSHHPIFHLPSFPVPPPFLTHCIRLVFGILYSLRLVKATVFPMVMYGCESWTVKKAECRSIDAFELWCWRRLLRVPWTARRSSQSILKEISPGCSLEGLMLKLKFQYFGHLIRRIDLLEKTLMLGGVGRRRRRGRTEDEMAGWHH